MSLKVEDDIVKMIMEMIPIWTPVASANKSFSGKR